MVAQTVKNSPVMWEMWIPSLGWEDPLEEGRAWRPTPVFLPGESKYEKQNNLIYIQISYILHELRYSHRCKIILTKINTQGLRDGEEPKLSLFQK